ncbi:uncharacterized protein A4U43_C03F11270 [Asparagus officinalis]|uniref:Bifunctional inhibitor/plant lipid transfer protein/seed storage helical domain-containing protein n=1 Tax=Asparagus officinalis TaxID=4686 RepID=A0A5P1FEB3_ASPOF|nr:protein YLS3-like [Asparagus officinalis]ONK74900.1 uncharacterized protein A4U43_C03F11270 [Asparagus officinalis]
MDMVHHLLVLVALLALVTHASSDLKADRAECSKKLVGVAMCLPFVRGEAKSPTQDCCTGYKQVTAKSIKCLCVLIKDRDDPELGLRINVTIAITLPASCDAPTNLSSCTGILKLSPDSKYAKEFQQFENMLEEKVKVNSTETGARDAAGANGGRKQRAMRIEMFPLIILVLILVM